MAHRADALSRAGLGAGPRPRPASAWALIALAVLELAWLAWFLNEPLPNAGRVGEQSYRRSMFLWYALPGVVPGNSASRAILYAAAVELSHVGNLPQRLPIVLGAAFIASAAVALGDLLLRAMGLRRSLGPWERIPLAFGLGAAGLGLATLGLGRLGLLAPWRPWPVRIGLGALIGAWVPGAWRRVGDGPGRPPDDPAPDPPSTPRSGRRRLAPLLGFAMVAGPFLAVMALGAMLPSFDYDAIEYHLQGPKEYFQAGRIGFLGHNVYTSMPFGVEMLHLLGMEVLGDWWWGALVGQLLVACFAPAAAAMIALTAWRWASGRAAWVAAVVYLTTPWIYRTATIPYVEGPLCYYHAALVWAAGRAWDADPGRRGRLWGLAGLLAGGAMACKYPGLVSAVVPGGLVALAAGLRGRSWRIPAAYAVGVAVVIGPWLAKNVVDTGNPVYPLAYRVFGSRHWDAGLDAKWSSVHGPRPVSAQAFVSDLLEVAGRSDWQSPLYVALAPLALLRPGSRRLAAALAGYVAYIFLTWWLLTHRLDRFWLPLLPAAAVLAGLGADWARGRGWAVLLAGVLAAGIASNLVYVSTALAGYNEWTTDLLFQRLDVPRRLDPALARIDEQLPPEAKVLLVGQAAVFYLRRPIVYNTVFNLETIETLARDRPPEQVHRDLVRMGIDYIYVDWQEIGRFRRPGNYGFTAFVVPEVFDRLVAAGVLEPPSQIGLDQQLFRVRGRAS